MAQMERNSDESHDDKWSNGAFKFNVAAPEFVPTAAQLPVTGYFYPCLQYVDGNTGAWIYVATPDQDLVQTEAIEKTSSIGSAHNNPALNHPVKETFISEEIKNKIIKQAEYMLSDISMLANETLVKHVNKDPEGFVPINFVSTLKKLKSLNINNQTVAQALRFSTKLVVSDDCKKVKRKKPFTEKEREELQLRTVIAENLPDDHSHQKIEKIFNSVGSIRSIRICQPQDHNRRSKGDTVVSNKLHALVEYESPESAEKAAEKLNDERNWRKSMRVRVMLRRSPKSVLKSKKSEFEVCLEDEGLLIHQTSEDPTRANTSEIEVDENSSAMKKTWVKNRAKTKPRSQLQTSTSLPTPTSLHASNFGSVHPTRGPRMPDGTRGFTMGRGKPLAGPS